MTTQSSTPNLELVIAWRRSNGFDFIRMQITPRFEGDLRTAIAAAESRLAHRTAKPYSIGDDLEDDQIMTSSFADLRPLHNTELAEVAVTALPANENGDAAPTTAAAASRPRAVNSKDPREFYRRLVRFAEPAEPLTQLRERLGAGQKIAFYALVLGDEPAKRVAYLRHMNPLGLVKPGMFFAGLADTLDRIEQDVFVMDDRVDLILDPDGVRVIEKRFFETLFFDLSAVDKKQHERIVRDALKKLPIAHETLDTLVSVIQGGRRARRRILALRESSHLAKVSMKHFRSALKRHGIAASRFIDGENRIAAREDDIDDLLEILNEDLYDGYLTGRKLVASKKGVRRA